MPRRHPAVALLLVAALTSLALTAVGDMASDPWGAIGGEAALTGPDSGLDPAVTRMNADGRPDSVTSQRPLKQRLVILAVVTSIATFGSIARRRPVLRSRGRLPLVAWANHGSRSPPQLQPLIP